MSLLLDSVATTAATIGNTLLAKSTGSQTDGTGNDSTQQGLAAAEATGTFTDSLQITHVALGAAGIVQILSHEKLPLFIMFKMSGQTSCIGTIIS
jgi:hypothetical protein